MRWVLLLSFAVGCHSKSNLGNQCTLNSDCSEPLICADGVCRNECRADRDCPLGTTCVLYEDGLGACTLSGESSCGDGDACPDYLVCFEDRCRQPCDDDSSCVSEASCIEVEPGTEICVDDPEPIDGGASDGGASDAGGSDGGATDSAVPPAITPCMTSHSVAPCSSDSCEMVDVAVGANHTCAVRSDGRLFCWGQNDRGQLGMPASESPVLLPSEISVSDIEKVASGAFHTCVRTSDADVFCFGDNSADQLGNQTTAEATHTPVPIDLSVDAVSIAAGQNHTCIISDDHEVWCWGAGALGQLGNGESNDSAMPVQAQGISNAIEIAAGLNHTCARADDGTVWCWGYNGSGQVGNGSTGVINAPDRYGADPDEIDLGASEVGDAISIAAGGTNIANNHSCAALDTGSLVCWGDNSYDQFGDDSLTEISAVVAGGVHTCAVFGDQSGVACFGANLHGELGTGAAGSSQATPFVIPGIESVAKLAASSHLGGGHTCAITNGSVVCWGANGLGQIGNGSEEPLTGPSSACALPE